MILDADGNLFGTTAEGGPNYSGSVFEVEAGSNAITTLASFDGANGEAGFGQFGFFPIMPGLVMDAQGNLYATRA